MDDYQPPMRRFQTTPKNLHDLKPLPEVAFEPLDPAVRYLWVLGRIIFWVIIFGIALFIAFFAGFFGWVIRNPAIGFPIIIGVPFLALCHTLLPFWSYRHWGYALRSTDLLIRNGIFWKSVIAIPFNRIQHVDSDSGPIERSTGLANLIIHTAGSQMGSVSIPGLPTDRAESLRDYLSQVGHTHANI